MKKTIALLLTLVMLVGMMPVFASASGSEITLKADKTYIVLGPDGFTASGSWIPQADEETNHRILMGGKSGKGEPNDPATIQICLPKDGNYKIYTYAKDYMSNPGTRYFEVRLGDIFKCNTGNHGKQGYFWQSSDTIGTFGGEYTFEVADMKGNYSRCAAIVITDDLEFNPSSDKDAVEKLIKEHQYKVGDLSYSASDVTGRPASEIAVRLNGNWMTFDVDPVLMNDRTMVPFRAIFEALGCTVSWDDENQVAIGKRNGKEIRLPIGSTRVTVAGVGLDLDQPAVLKDSRTLVPLRFVSEALGAQVKWDDPTQTVTILAAIPDEMVLFGQESYNDVGAWILEGAAEGAFKEQAMRGAVPEKQAAKLEDADTTNNKPAVAVFQLNQGGTYRVWARSKDYATNQQGDRFFQLAFNDQPMMEHKYGTHGGTGYAWATGGTVELPAGENTLYVHDTSGFYARFDAVLLSKDLNYVPAESYDTVSQLVLPYNNTPQVNRSFPAYAKEQGMVTDSTTIENDSTKVVFSKVQTSKGQVVQNEIYTKHDGAWVQTKARAEDLGYVAIRADEASYSVSQDKYGMKMSYQYEGRTFGGLTSDPYKAGIPYYFVPTDYTVEGDKIVLTSANEAGTLTATWSLDEETYPLVSIDFTPATDGYYTVAAWEGGEFIRDEFEYALAPFRIQFKRVPEAPELFNEQYLFTPMGTYTLYANNKYNALPVTKGVVFEPSWIPQRWVYKDNCVLGISMHSADGMYRGTAFAPVMGTEQSKMTAGTPFNMQVRIVSDVASWSDNYHNTVTNLFDVNDYRKNYVNSLNDTIFNTRNLMLDDKYGGWDSEDMAHYNMEGMNVTSVANSMIAMQDYLLSEDDAMLEKRAIPTLANALTRGYIHFNRIGVSGGASYWTEGGGKTTPDPIGEPVSGFNANVIGGMYDMTRGTLPFLHDYALEKGQKAVTNSYGSIAPFVNDLSMYKYTGDKTYLDKAIAGADAYLEKTVYAESNTLPGWTSFIYISYYPNLASLMDIYEVTKDQKYLDAAEYVAEWMATGLWVPGVDGEKKTAPVMANDLPEMKKRFHYGSETSASMWWAGPKQMRIGRETLTDIDHNNEIITERTREVEGWIPSRVGLGVEQASTFGASSNIVMQSFVGDFMRLSAYTGNEFLATAARNAIIGRYRSYDGYYRNAFITYQQESNYPVDGPDYTGIYWHHIPPFLAMLEDFIINQTFAWSGRNISFPSLRQQGYAYFNSNQYGHEAGKFYDEDNMWAWLAEDTVHPDSIQVDWMAARKDGVAGIAFMNEDEVATTTTITLGEKFGADKNYTGTATLYDKTGKIGTVDVKDGKFTLTIPAKSLQAVKLNIASVKAPAFASIAYDPAEKTEIGGTISNHKTGKGYTLQMSGDNYFAYVYTTYKPSQAKSATLTYTVNGKEKTLTDNVYPYEFIVRVDDVNAEFNYKLKVQKTDGSTEDSGEGVLMTKKVSDQKGIKYEAPAVSDTGTAADVSAEAMALQFEPTFIKLNTQGAGSNQFRFVVAKDSIPFAPTAENVRGLLITADLITRSEGKKAFKGYITGFEDRGTTCVLVVKGNIDVGSYSSTSEGDVAHSWENMAIHPYSSSGEIEAAEKKVSELRFDPVLLKLNTQGQNNGKFRFVIAKEGLPFEPNAENVTGLVIKGIIRHKADQSTLDFEGTVEDYEDRGTTCVLVVSGNQSATQYNSTSEGEKKYTWENLTLYPAK